MSQAQLCQANKELLDTNGTVGPNWLPMDPLTPEKLPVALTWEPLIPLLGKARVICESDENR
jgi:hypothetical protein